MSAAWGERGRVGITVQNLFNRTFQETAVNLAPAPDGQPTNLGLRFWSGGRHRRLPGFRTPPLYHGFVLAALEFGVHRRGRWWSWQRYVAPTRVAFVNYEEFQLARIVRARASRFVQVERLRLDDLARARQFPVVFVFGRGLTLSDTQKAALEQAGRTGTRVFIEGATDPASDVTNIRGRDLDAVTEKAVRRPDNYRNLLAYSRRVIDRKVLFAPAPAPPKVVGQDVYFHLGDEHVFPTFDELQAYMRGNGLYKEGRPRVAVLATVPGPFNSNRDHVDSLISALIAKNYNVFPIASNQRRLALLKAVNPDLVVMMPHGRLASIGDASGDAVEWLQGRNIPVLTPLSVFDDFEHWSGDQKGYQGALMTMNVVLPEHRWRRALLTRSRREVPRRASASCSRPFRVSSSASWRMVRGSSSR